MSHLPVLSASSLQGNDVKNHQGESLGDIKDFMVDTSDGNTSYAILDFGGFIGIGNKLFAVPMTALKLDSNDECFKLDATKEKLKDAQGFDQDNWPDFADQTWRAYINKFYSI